MRQIKFISLILIISSCATQKYFLTNNPELISSFQSRENYNFYLLNTVDSYQYRNKIILIPDEHSTGQVMENTIQLIQDKKYKELDKFLDNVDTNDLDLKLATGLLELFKKNYTNAILEFKKNNQSDLQYIADLLIVDCEYELALSTSYKINYQEFLKKYQTIIDNYELTDLYIEIINDRIKFIRYKM